MLHLGLAPTARTLRLIAVAVASRTPAERADAAGEDAGRETDLEAPVHDGQVELRPRSESELLP